MQLFFKIIKAPIDFLLTMIFWFYFIFGYIFFYIPVLFLLSLFIRKKETMFQKTNKIFYRVFFILMNIITPGLSIHISKEVSSIRSAIVIANHRSYLDPILLISIFQKQRTIVKGIFFKFPVLRWVMKSGGYLPFALNGEFKYLMIEGIQNMSAFLEKGGVLFIFPEGRRSRDGKLGNFQKGSFSIAGKFDVPVEVIYINNTNRLFTPGKFFFNTCVRNTITVEKLGTIIPDQESNRGAREMRDKALQMYNQRMKDDFTA
jgi:1-acyl-sn-glycerol-3-phosphate acyltransferase